MKIGDFFVQLGVKADTFTVKDFGKAIADIPLSAAAALTSLAGLSIGFLDLTKNVVGLAVNLNSFHAATGLNTEELQRWEQVLKSVGISGDVAASSITALSQVMAQAHLGNGTALGTLAKLGVGLHGQDAYQLMMEIRERIQAGRFAGHINDASLLLGSIGAGGMMPALTMGPEQFNNEFNRAPILNENAQRSMLELQKAMADLENSILKDFIPILLKLEPDIVKLTGVLESILGFLSKESVGLIGATQHGAHKAVAAFHAFSAWNDRANDWMAEKGLRQSQSGGAGPVSVTQNITTSDPSEVVAQMVVNGVTKYVTRGMTKAMKQFNNSGT